MTGNAAADAIDWHALFTWTGYGLMSLLSVLGGKLWRDVERLKAGWLTRQDFEARMKETESERDRRHVDNTGRFERLERKHYEGQVVIERRLGEVMAKIAELRSTPPNGTTERRRGY